MQLNRKNRLINRFFLLKNYYKKGSGFTDWLVLKCNFNIIKIGKHLASVTEQLNLVTRF